MHESGPETSTSDPSTPIGEVRIATYSLWQAVAVILITLIAIWAIGEASSLVSMLLISFFFSLALQPAVNRLCTSRGWRRGAAVGFVYLIGALFFVFLIFIITPSLVAIASAIGANAAEWVDTVNSWMSNNFGLDQTINEDGLGAIEDFDAQFAGWAKSAFGNVVGIVSSGLGLIFSAATIAMFTFYFTADAPKIQKAVLGLFSTDVQARIGWTWDEAVRQTGGYFYSRSILMVINGLGFFFTMVLVGVPTMMSAGLAIFGAFVSVFIPAIGTYIGGAVPILVTLGVQGLTQALIVLGYVLVYQQIENYYLSPKISANTMSLNGGVAFGAALAGGALAGPMGAFTALPVAALITSVISNYAAHNEVLYVSPYAVDVRSSNDDEGAEASSD